MHLTTLLLSIIAIPGLLVASWRVPEGQPDGLYSVTIDDSGDEVHKHIPLDPNPNLEWVSVGDTAPVTHRAKFAKRQFGGFFEECAGYGIDPISTDAAFNCFLAFVTQEWNRQLSANMDWYCRSDSVVVYVCNFSSDASAYINPETVRQVIQGYVTDYCGQYRAGWALCPSNGGVNRWLWQMGYEEDRADFCYGRGSFYPLSCALGG